MKVLQLSPLWLPVSRDARGGIETFLAALLPAMARLGVDSTLLASGDSRTESDLIPAVERSLVAEMERGTATEYAYFEQRQLALALEHAADFDVIHSHIGPGAYFLSKVDALKGRVVHTVHSPVSSDLQRFIRAQPGCLFSAVSENQARKIREAGATSCRAIHNGIDFAQFSVRSQGGDGLVFIGRMESVKGPDLAARVARRLGMPLMLAGPIVERDFFETRVAPLLDDRIKYAGVVDHKRKNELFCEVACAVLPFRGEEPFGLVAIEAMACGTPVVALARGALPEIVDAGVTGYLADEENEEELGTLVSKAVRLDRNAIRAHAEARFDIAIAAASYAQLYGEISARQSVPLVPT